ncbi:MAG: ATP-binding cassette domain-containing protein [Mameliella sp.]|nr:ATP-binding cassette domain-containing protein [Mameliella sp.]
MIEVAESFGIGLSDSEFVIFDHKEFEVGPGERIYITGQSGSGKSLLLRELAAQLGAEGKKVANLETIELDDRPIIDQIGSSMSEATMLLAAAGISDAYLYVRKPSELSDGQRYRARLAKVLDTDADVWVADEFGAVLDRVSAKAVSYTIAKAAMKHGKTLIVATTHLDLREELGPTIYVNKRYADRIKVEVDMDNLPVSSEVVQ